MPGRWVTRERTGRCPNGQRCAAPESVPCGVAGCLWEADCRGMIPEVDIALRAVIEREAVHASGVEVVFDAPTKDWAARRTMPTVDVYLYDIREDLRRRERGLINEYDERPGHGPPLPPRYFKLSYLVTAWTQRPEDEHRLLASLLSCFLRHDALPRDVLTGTLADLGLPVPVTIALPPPEDRSFADVWSALGGELKPSLDIVVSAPTATGQVYVAGPPVQEPHRVRPRWPRRVLRIGVRRVATPRAARGGRTAACGACARRADSGATAGPRNRRRLRRPSAAGRSRGGGLRRPTRAGRKPRGRDRDVVEGAGSLRRAMRSRRIDGHRRDRPRRRRGAPACPDRSKVRTGGDRPRGERRRKAAGRHDRHHAIATALLARLRDVEERIRDLVAVRRAGDPSPDDPFRGLYLTDEDIDRLLDPAAPAGGAPMRQRRLGVSPPRPTPTGRGAGPEGGGAACRARRRPRPGTA